MWRCKLETGGEISMNPIYVPLLSALAGGIIASAASITTILIQAKIGDRRERIRQAAMLALEDLKMRLPHAADGAAVYPISLYLHHQLEILNAIEENDLTPERLRKIMAADEALVTAIVGLDRQFRSREQSIREGNQATDKGSVVGTDDRQKR
jgi:hypothetical protein